MAAGEMRSPSSYPPPYSAVDTVANKGGGQAPYPPYPMDQGGYPTPQANAFSGGYPPPGPGAYPPAGYPPSASYPPGGAYSQAPPGPGFYQTSSTQQPMTVHTTTTTAIVLPAGNRCVRCAVGRVEEHFTCCGICCAICLFPCGIICCLSSRVRSCNNCGAIYM